MDTRGYVRIVKDQLDLFLRQCRSLYEFLPESADIDAAFNAVHDMGLRREAELSRLLGPKGIVVRDCKNFQRLLGQLEAKHSRRLSSNQALFRMPPKAAVRAPNR